MSESNPRPPVGAAERTAPRRSWVDLLMAGIDRLPGPAWLFFVAMTLFFLAGNVGLRWLDGSRPVGAVDIPVVTFSILTLYGLAASYYINRAARRSLAAFRPALGALEGGYPELERRLTTISPIMSIAAVVIGIGIQVIGVASSPTGWGISADASPVTNGFTLVQEAFFSVFFSAFAFRAIRQLRMIVKIHRGATNINLYDPETNAAFSRLTLRTAVAVAVPYALAQVLSTVSTGISAFEIGLLVTLALIAIALFVLPLIGMHGRLLELRESMMVESNRRFENSAMALHRAVDAGDFGSADGLGKAMAALVVEGDRVKRLSTWPWSAETLRRLLSSIALPVLLWAITTLLGRFVL